mgnify:CR=1 FL=1
MDKIPKKDIFVRKTIYCNTKTATNFLHKKSLCNRNKFPSQKQLSSEFLSEKHNSVTEKNVFITKISATDKVSVKEKKLLSQKQADR